MGTKESLKNIATEAVQRTGVQSSTLRDLGAAVGIKSSSVVYHFPTKGLLVHAIAEDYIHGALEELAEIHRRETTVRGRLLALVQTFERLFEQGKMCLCGALASDTHQLDPQTRKLVEQSFSKVEDWITGVLRDQERFQSDPGAAKMRARLILSSLEGALLLDKSAGSNLRLAAVKAWILDSVAS